jgi:hypothetical protein
MRCVGTWSPLPSSSSSPSSSSHHTFARAPTPRMHAAHALNAGGLGLSAILTARAEPFRAWGRHLAGFGAQVRVRVRVRVCVRVCVHVRVPSGGRCVAGILCMSCAHSCCFVALHHTHDALASTHTHTHAQPHTHTHTHNHTHQLYARTRPTTPTITQPAHTTVPARPRWSRPPPTTSCSSAACWATPSTTYGTTSWCAAGGRACVRVCGHVCVCMCV